MNATPRTIIHHIGNSGYGGSGDCTLEGLFKMLAEHPLDRSFEAYGEFLEPPVRAAERDNGWAPDGSEGEFHFWGNFFDWAYGFSLETNDPALLERLRAAVATNRARLDFQAQPPRELLISMLAEYIRGLGICAPRWDGELDGETGRTVVILRAVDDEDLVECRLRHEGAVVDYVCNRRTLKDALLVLCRTRRPELGYSLADILGPVLKPQPGTLVAALAGLPEPAVVDQDPNPENKSGQAEPL